MLIHWLMTNRFDIFNATLAPFSNMSESGAFLRSARDRFGVLNLSYWFLGASPELPDQMTWLSTYDESYMAIYMRDYTPLKDKAFQVCFQRLLPLDWDEVRSTEESVQHIHEVAEQYGVGRHGISIPIRDPGVGDAMFSINFECEDRHWLEVRQQLVNNIHLFAHYYHQRMRSVIATRPVSAEFDLSPARARGPEMGGRWQDGLGNGPADRRQRTRHPALYRERDEQASRQDEDAGRRHRREERHPALMERASGPPRGSPDGSQAYRQPL